ncbi:hypothetical protein [Peptacetobacter sp.]|uniref:hypothetical protein n=1 Tax=Peptacetobacter sp. TaxID=2991975 RepID=UPI002E7965E2|nr:hypothetical protein [Peptacetobacter sp.]MEE0451311.1 hypothetical protein [Peptacetobacter sp.]
MNKRYILEREEYQQFMCDNLHAILNTGLLDDNSNYVDVKMIDLAFQLLISELYDLSDVVIEKELEYPKDYIKLYEKELEEKKVEIEELKFEIKDLKEYYM